MLTSIEGSPEVPFWAPDSRRLAFFDGGKLKKIDINGGPPVTVAEKNSSLPGSGSWNQEDVIIFDQINTGLVRVPAAGGHPTPATELDRIHGEAIHTVPWFLPDGRHFLYLAGSRDPEYSRVYVGDLASKARKEVIGFGSRTIYAAPGYLLFLRDRMLMALPFDAGKLATTGDAVLVAEQVDFAMAGNGNTGYFSASQNGVLAYTSGSVGGRVQLTWFDRKGKKLGTVGSPGNVQWFSISPDGSAAVLSRLDPQSGRFDLWSQDLGHSAESRLTFTGSNRYPVWSADGSHILFESSREGVDKVYQKAANGTGPEEVLEAAFKLPTDASRDGRYLLTQTGGDNPKTGNDIWVLPLFGDRKPFPYVQTEFRDARPRLSPDGHWLAYESDSSKRLEVYVISFPKPGGKWQISTDGVRNQPGAETGANYTTIGTERSWKWLCKLPARGFSLAPPNRCSTLVFRPPTPAST
jgi:Tol biopolymer transport system component